MNALASALPGDAQVFWIHSSGRLLDTSERAAQALGYSRHELRGMAVWDIDPAFPEALWHAHWAELRRAGSLHFQTSHRHRGGSLSPVEVFAQLVELEGRYYNCALVYPFTSQRLAENALRESEERLDLALTVSGQGLYDLDFATGAGVFNDTFARMLGYEPYALELTPELWVSWLHPDEREPVLRLYQDCLEGGRVDFDAEHRLRMRSGDWLWVRSRAEVVQRDPAGRPIRLIGTQLDIGEHKREEIVLQALRESEERFRSVFEDAPLGIALIGGADAEISMANPAYQRLVGYGDGELRRLTLADITHPEDLAEELGQYRALLEDRVSSYRREKRFVRRDGRVVWGDLTVSAIRDGQGKPVFALGMVEDMTQRRQAEEALRASEALMDNIIAQSPFAILIFDSTGAIVRRNKAVLDLFQLGDDAQDLLRYNLFLDEQLREHGYLGQIERVFTHGESARFQARYRLDRGDPARGGEGARYVELDSTFSPLMSGSGRVTHAVVYHIDVTERQAAETRVRHHLDLEQTLARISGAMSRPGWADLDARLHAALEETGCLLRAECGALLMLAPEAAEPRLTHSWCPQGAQPSMAMLQTAWPAVRETLLDRLRHEGVAFFRLADIPSPPGRWGGGEARGSLVCVPVDWGERLHGFIALSLASEEALLSADDLGFVRMVAESIAHSLQHLESEQGLREHGRFLEDLDKISRILGGRVQDVDLIEDLAAAILDIFQVDRAFLLHPCDPDAPTFRIRIEVARPEWPGVFADTDPGPDGVEIIPDDAFREHLRCALSRLGPVVAQLGESEESQVMARRYGVRSQLSMVLHPQADRPWLLAIQQCGASRCWTGAEQRLFQAVAERAGEALSGHLLLKRIQASEERFAKAFRSSPALTILSALGDGRIIDANDRWLDVMGYRREEVIGRTIEDIDLWGHPRERDELLSALQASGSMRDVPVRVRTKSGEERDHLWSADILSLSGQPVLLSAVQDVTERKRSERALRLAQISIQRSTDAVFWITAQGRFIHVNEQACASLGYTREELLRMVVWDIDPDFSEDIWVEAWEATRAEATGHFETRHRRRDGSCFPVEIMANYVTYEGDEYSFSFARDISERKRAEAELASYREHLEELVQERTAALEAANAHLHQAMNQLVQAEKLAALGSLVAGVAHELNTPLGNARMVASTLDEWLREAEAAMEAGALRRSHLARLLARGREAVNLLERNTERAADLIGHFKEVAVDQTSVRRRQFNLRRTVEEVLATLGPRLKHTAHRVDLRIPPHLELDSYPGPLEQVIANLIGNSLDHGFAELDAGRIEISAQSQGAEHILLCYGDDGSGIPDALRARIFEPFFTTRLGQGGSGLGLYIVYNLVTGMLGGAIEIDAQAGAGAHFRIRLPRAAPQSSAPI